MALAFYHSPVVYMKKVFTPGTRFVACMYFVSLLVSLYMCVADYGYVCSLVVTGLQVITCLWMANVAIRGVDTANDWVYKMVAAGAVDKIKGMIFKDKGSDLPI